MGHWSVESRDLAGLLELAKTSRGSAWVPEALKVRLPQHSGRRSASTSSTSHPHHNRLTATKHNMVCVLFDWTYELVKLLLYRHRRHDREPTH